MSSFEHRPRKLEGMMEIAGIAAPAESGNLCRASPASWAIRRRDEGIGGSKFDSRSGLRSAERVRRFRFHIPTLFWLAGLVLVFARVSPAQEAPANGVPRTVLVMGDSLAAGYGVEPEAAFPALLQKKILAAGFDFKVVNAGLSGDTSAGGLRRINWLLRRPVTVLLLELGGNDGLRGIQPATTRTNLQQIIDRTREKNPGMRLVIAGMRMPDNMGEEFTRGFREVFTELARANRATLIPFLLEGVGGDPDLNQPDLIHPNAKGHQIVAGHVWNALEPVLKELQLPTRDAAPKPVNAE